MASPIQPKPAATVHTMNYGVRRGTFRENRLLACGGYCLVAVIHNQQTDTLISIFNSPFGPDVLVVTDKLAEGIDLHRYCRHLVHYELKPSPIRTVQRNGRLRRVNSWAAITGQPIRYAYPAFYGTRDHRLVQIMKKRINSFSLLLGGVQDFDVDEVVDAAEKWRNDVISAAKTQLAKTTGSLRANEFMVK